MYIQLHALWLPIKGTSDYGDFQQIGHSDHRVLSSTWNAFMYIMAFLTKYFENIKYNSRDKFENTSTSTPCAKRPTRMTM